MPAPQVQQWVLDEEFPSPNGFAASEQSVVCARCPMLPPPHLPTPPHESSLEQGWGPEAASADFPPCVPRVPMQELALQAPGHSLSGRAGARLCLGRVGSPPERRQILFLATWLGQVPS